MKRKYLFILIAAFLFSVGISNTVIANSATNQIEAIAGTQDVGFSSFDVTYSAWPEIGSTITLTFDAGMANTNNDFAEYFYVILPENWSIVTQGATPATGMGCPDPTLVTTSTITSGPADALGRDVAYWGTTFNGNLAAADLATYPLDPLSAPLFNNASQCGPYDGLTTFTLTVSIDAPPGNDTANLCPGTNIYAHDLASLAGQPDNSFPANGLVTHWGADEFSGDSSSQYVSLPSNCPEPTVELSKTVVTNPADCTTAGGGASMVNVAPGDNIYYCFVMSNTSDLNTYSFGGNADFFDNPNYGPTYDPGPPETFGGVITPPPAPPSSPFANVYAGASITLTTHTLVDPLLGTITLTPPANGLASGESFAHVEGPYTVGTDAPVDTCTTGIVNTATYTGTTATGSIPRLYSHLNSGGQPDYHPSWSGGAAVLAQGTLNDAMMDSATVDCFEALSIEMAESSVTTDNSNKTLLLTLVTGFAAILTIGLISTRKNRA